MFLLICIIQKKCKKYNIYAEKILFFQTGKNISKHIVL